MRFLRIRPEQMKVFEDEDLRRYVQGETARVVRDHDLPPGEAASVVGAAIVRTRALGIDQEADVSRFIDWCAVRGTGFEARPEYDEVRRILEDRSLPGWGRMQLAAEALEATTKGG